MDLAGDKWIEIKDESDNIFSKTDVEKDKTKVNLNRDIQYLEGKRFTSYLVCYLFGLG